MERKAYSVFKAFKDAKRFCRKPLEDVVSVNNIKEQLENVGRFHLWRVITQLALFNGSSHALSDLSANSERTGSVLITE